MNGLKITLAMDRSRFALMSMEDKKLFAKET